MSQIDVESLPVYVNYLIYNSSCYAYNNNPKMSATFSSSTSFNFCDLLWSKITP